MKRQTGAIRRTLLAGLMILAAEGAFGLAPGVFNANLTASERARLDSGEILIRNTGRAKSISIEPVNVNLKAAIGAIKDLNPSYLVEVIQIRPYRPEDDLTGRLRDILLDIPSYRGIPYWSVSGQTWYDLYSSAEVRSQKTQGDSVGINAALVMEPFTPIDASIVLRRDGEGLFYSMSNNNDLKARGITAVKKSCMNSTIVVFRAGDSLVLYGIGGVKAPVIFFLKDRIETSFMNRIKTFCMYVYEKL
ncbi:MAG: hypothetical protein LBR23_07010 [Spirochaetaceae bacterium]|nr:hypothetical protein [Spirochaetaceae bacterium]